MGPETYVINILAWLAVLKFLQIAVAPHLERSLPRIGYAAAYPVSVLLFALAAWYLGLAGLPIHLAFAPFAIVVCHAAYRRSYSLEKVRNNIPIDLVFLVFFSFMLLVRFINPTISFAEKFMDHAFLASMIATPIVPPLDPWYAGGTLAVYYYLGYWIVASLAIGAGVSSPVAFNLGLPTVFGLAAVALYALGSEITPKYPILPVMALILPNPSFIYHALLGEQVQTIMWESTRTITSTINEYPLFSFLWGDLHAHVIGIFNQSLFILLIVYAYRSWDTLSDRGRLVLCSLAMLSLGSMPGINSWDVLIYAPITVAAGILIWRRHSFALHGRWTRSWLFLAAVPPAAIAVYLPYYLQLRSQGIEGVALVTAPSDPVQFLLVHGFFLAVFYLCTAGDLARRPYLAIAAAPLLFAGYTAAAIAALPLTCFALRKRRSIPAYLAILGLSIMIVCEIVYIKDNMGETYFRMNTVFKFYIAAWLLSATAALGMIGTWVGSKRQKPFLSERQRTVGVAVFTVLFLGVPLMLNLTFGFGTGTLDGLAYLDTAHPEDAQAVAFLRSLQPGERIVEAEGGDYTYYSRISSFTGIPAVIGMPFHEYMWRGDEARVMERTADIQLIYEDPSQSVVLMQKYNATLLYVGPSERDRYSVTIPLSAFEPIYDQDGVVIYRRIG